MFPGMMGMPPPPPATHFSAAPVSVIECVIEYGNFVPAPILLSHAGLTLPQLLKL
jgi:hypothetical protein